MKKTVSDIFLLVLLLSCGVFSNKLFPTGNNVSDICQTPVCHNVASRLLHDMDPSVNPCDDFYQFACGGYLNSTELIDDSNHTSKFTEFQRRVRDNLTMILEKNGSKNESKYLKLARTLYKTCKNKKDTIWKFKTAIKNWPAWNESAFDFNRTMFNVGNTKQWKNYFFEFYSTGDDHPIVVEPYKSELSAEDLVQGLDNTQVNKYYNSMIKLAEKINASVYNINYKNDLKKVIDFEIELARERLETVIHSNPTFDVVKMSLSELMNNYSFFNWHEYISYLRGSPVTSSTTIIITNFSYMKKLQYLINSTKNIKKILANYVTWKYAEDNTKTARFLERQNCANVVSSKLPIAVGAIYFQNYNYPKLKNAGKEIEKMVLKIRGIFFKMIYNATWIDDETKIDLLKKLMSFQHVIGYINKFSNNVKVNNFYTNLELFVKENLNDAMQRIQLFERMISYSMLQSDFFDIEYPNYINYGALGTIIGHEMTHGFDIIGINYDSYGRWNDSHWTSLSKENFHNRSKCIIEQYDNFTVPEVGLNINGTITQSETVADNSGIKAAYRAYEILKNTNERLSGLNYTPKQLFWMSYANSLCQKNSNKYLKNSYLIDAHPPSKFRVIGTLSNMPEFAKDFNCPLGSNMNPTKKCSVW